MNEAIGELNTAVRIAPTLPLAHFYLGNAYALLPNGSADAVREYREAVRLDTGDARMHSGLGTALVRTEDSTEAMGEFEAALRLDPGLAEAHAGLADLLMKTPDGREEAIDEYRAALRKDPNLAAAREGLAKALLARGRGF
jgi:tetratricopeptide (TPR) repeat protein